MFYNTVRHATYDEAAKDLEDMSIGFFGINVMVVLTCYRATRTSALIVRTVYFHYLIHASLTARYNIPLVG